MIQGVPRGDGWQVAALFEALDRRCRPCTALQVCRVCVSLQERRFCKT
jgi:hypothetical protein